MPTKILKALLLSVLMVALLAGCGGGQAPSGAKEAPKETPKDAKPAATAPATTAASTKDPLLIGSIMPLTGSYAYNGGHAKIAIEMAIKEVNDAGGIQGHAIKLLMENCNYEPSKQVAAANKLIFSDKVRILHGPFLSSGLASVQKITEKEEVPDITCCGSAAKLTQEGQKFFFRGTLSDLYQTSALAKYAVEKQGKKRVAIMAESGSHGQGTVEGWQKDLKEMFKMEPVAIERFKDNDVDFAAQLSKVKAANPDAIVVAAMNAAAGARILTQAKEMGINALILHSSGLAGNTEYVQLAKGLAEGVVAPCAFLPDNPDPKVQEFVAKFKKLANNEVPVGKEASQAYDNIMIIAQALNQKDASGKYKFPLKFTDGDLKADRLMIRDALITVKGYRGASGVEISYGPEATPKDRDGITTPIVATVKNGKWVPAQ